MDEKQLVRIAFEAMENAAAPYSKFPVGAALLAKSGRVYKGANVESSSYGLSMCAERVALFKALSEGERDFTAIAIATTASRACPPCGACRQLLWDYARDIDVYISENKNTYQKYNIRDFFPFPFDSEFLD